MTRQHRRRWAIGRTYIDDYAKTVEKKIFLILFIEKNYIYIHLSKIKGQNSSFWYNINILIDIFNK